MDFRQTFQGSGNRADNGSAPVAQSQADQPTHHSKKSGRGNGGGSRLGLQNLFSLVLLFGIAALLILLAVSFVTKGGEGKFVDSGKYQAVFLNNGQVYFGKVKSINANYVDLQNVYYLTQTTTTGASTGTATNNDYTLVKLGCQQIHDPYDQMVISRDQVSFWENLKDDGKVVQKIKEFIQTNPNGPDCTQVSNQTQSSTNTTQSTTSPNTAAPAAKTGQ